MGLHRHEPVEEKAMDWISPNYSICQLLREIYHAVDDPETKLKCRVATSMAKSMSRKLTEYKDEWEEGFWERNPKFLAIIKDAICKSKIENQ